MNCWPALARAPYGSSVDTHLPVTLSRGAPPSFDFDLHLRRRLRRHIRQLLRTVLGNMPNLLAIVADLIPRSHKGPGGPPMPFPAPLRSGQFRSNGPRRAPKLFSNFLAELVQFAAFSATFASKSLWPRPVTNCAPVTLPDFIL